MLFSAETANIGRFHRTCRFQPIENLLIGTTFQLLFTFLKPVVNNAPLHSEMEYRGIDAKSAGLIFLELGNQEIKDAWNYNGIQKVLTYPLTGLMAACFKRAFEIPNAILQAISNENPDYEAIFDAAHAKSMGELEFLQWAFAEWHGREMRESEINRYFRSFFIEQKVPAWARHHARQTLQEAAEG